MVFVRIVEIVSFVAVVIALFYLYEANEISKKAFEDGSKANREALARTDSSLALQKKAIDEEARRTEIERRSQSFKEVESFQKQKPILDIRVPIIESTDTSVVLEFSLRNRGPSKMEQVLIYLKVKKFGSTDSILTGSWSFPFLNSGSIIAIPYEILNWRSPDTIFCFIDVRYSWFLMNQNNEAISRSFVFLPDKVTKKYEARVLDENDIKKVWGK